MKNVAEPLSGYEILSSLEPFINYIPGGFLMINEEGTIVTANTMCSNMFGYGGEMLAGKNLSILLPQKSKSKHAGHIQSFFKLPLSRSMGSGLELYGKKKNGDLFPIEVSLGSYTTDQGMLAMAFIADITARVEAEKELINERNFSDTLIDTVNALIIVQSADGSIVRINKEYERVMEFKAEKLMGKRPWENPSLSKESKDSAKDMFEKIISSENEYELEELWTGNLNNNRLILWTNTVLKDDDGNIKYVIKTGIDITENKNTERNLLNAVMEGQENERKRLSRELHDGLAPMLSSVKNNLEVVSPVVEELAGKHRRYFYDSMSQLNAAMDEIRTMSRDLMPRTLEDFGLISALKELCNRTTRISKMEIEFYKSEFKQRLDSNIEIGLYRISQELLNNAVKHSEATQLKVQLVKHSKSVVLSVEDNGKGFIVNTSSGKGLGLKNIMSRVKSLNGFLEFDSRPKVGTSVTIEIPLE
jgi:PAS domain S-box-containing protein